MIKSLIVKDQSACCVDWLDMVPWLLEKKEIIFSPGLNVLVGPNGSGKSTILSIMARTLCCEQGETQAVTHHSLHKLRTMFEEKILLGVVPVHDGSPTVYLNPENKPGLIGGSFDDDFFDLGLRNALGRGSAGQLTIHQSNRLFMMAVDNKLPKAVWMYGSPEKYVWLAEHLAGTLPADRPTMLLDEPTKAVDLLTQILYWKAMVKLSGRVQIIVASHSILCMGIPGATYIETRDGYMDEVRRAMKGIL